MAVTMPDRSRTDAMYVGGGWVQASSRATIDSENPATEEIIGRVPDAGADDVDAAVRVAGEASEEWRSLPWQRRAKILREFADRIESQCDELATLDTLDSGNPISSMRADVLGAAGEIRYYAGIASELKGITVPTTPDTLSLTERVAYPVVGRIVPFNHPFKFAAGKAAAPLAAGCAIVIKPGEQTSLSALRIGELVEGLFPAGVVNVVTGRGATAGSALVVHPDVPRIAFTGSVPTGRRVAEAAARHVKHVSLELGGKNPMIVFDDTDPKRAADGAVAAMNLARSMGQSCGSSSRVFVHSRIKDAFCAALAERCARLRVGDPMDPETEMGPLAYRAHYEKVTELVASGVSEGARLIHGGGRPAGLDRGFYLEPTVFADVEDGMRIAREEIFGPVMSVFEWSDYEDVIRRANATEYGLTANVWTNDISVAVRTARRLQAGYVYINGTGKRPTGSPFGGIKSSGIGKENSLEELLSYTSEKSITATLF
jgi:betaine-aldehyde dehydrogenase